jgi:predicted small secreted protein
MAAAAAPGYAADMKLPAFRPVLALLTLVLCALAAAGCNTASGFGKDVEKLGEKIEKKAAR